MSRDSSSATHCSWPVGDCQCPATVIDWKHFDSAYKRACETSQPQDWMDAALAAQQIRHAGFTTLPSASASSWQPIETAPKDGTHILMYRHPEGIDEAWWKKEHGMMGVHWGGNSWWYPSHSLPTHWMPLPEAPDVK